MTKDRYPIAIEREKAKLAGVQAHPADGHSDPLAAQLAKQADATPKKPRLKHLGGSNSDKFNTSIANAVLQATWVTSRDQEGDTASAVGQALAAIAPQNEVEGMLAAQMVAAHHASMEGYRRAMLPNQTVEGRAMNLKHGTKASQTFAALLDALNRHRGKGQQKVVVEHIHRHVHLHQGDDAPTVDHAEGGGGEQEIGGQPHAPRLAQSTQPLAPVWSEDAGRQALSGTGDAERTVPDARREQPRRASGHG